MNCCCITLLLSLLLLLQIIYDIKQKLLVYKHFICIEKETKWKMNNTSVQTAMKKGLLDSSVIIGATQQSTDIWFGCSTLIEDELDSILKELYNVKK